MTSLAHEPHDRRILVLAPAGKDASLARDVLGAHGLTAVVCPNLDGLIEEWREGAGLLLLAEEALFPRGFETIATQVAGQPPWSDIPILVFLKRAATAASIDRLRALQNVAVLERPIRIPALISTIRAALRARTRQYEIRDLMSELGEANRAKDDFLAMVSHELRTPLTVIRGIARILVLQQQQNRPLEATRMLADVEKIDRNAAVLARLVDDLLDLSRLRKRRFQLEVRPVDLVQVVQIAFETNRLTAESKGVQLSTQVEPASAIVLGDNVRLEQIVSNLLANAIKFTPASGSVMLRLEATVSHADIIVSDTGEGISPELLPHVFEPFRQGEAGSRGGLGLGLAIVRQFVELHWGTIIASSEGPGRGATFTVRLPLRSSTPVGVNASG
jgi:two-component system, sensor histidine kinase